MAGVSLSMTVDDEEVRRAIQGLATRSLNLREAFDDVGASLLTSTQQRFEDEEDPAGEPWAELAESTQNKLVTKRKRRGKEHILRERGHLYGSLTYLAKPTEVAIGSNRKYAAIHQLGGTEDMAPGPAAIPARPFLGISGEDEREIMAIFMDHLQAGLT